MAGLPVTTELKLRRSLVHRQYDMKRLADGEDLNDALLDFFVKLGQAVIPCGGLEGGHPSVAYLGSLFYDMLRKGGIEDGRVSHANVANWAKRRLGQGGLFFDGVGALAVPVNETLQATQGRKQLKEKHWWLALLLNPRGGSRAPDEEDMTLLCLDSVARAETRIEPPLRACRQGNPGYTLEVGSIYRQGFVAFLRFRARGDGSAGALPEPRRSRLLVGGREFAKARVTLSLDNRGGPRVAGHIEGFLEFDLDSAMRTCGDYALDFGEPGTYTPMPRLGVRREPTPFQQEAARLLGGYVAKEWELSDSAVQQSGTCQGYDPARLEGSVRLPDVPQQETANDCGFFILEQILLALQLTPDGLRTLARASSNMVTALPWPSQKQISCRKAKLRGALQALFEAADSMLSDDVEVLLRNYPDLRKEVQDAMWDGPRFSEAVRTLASMSLPRQEFTLEDLDGMSTKALRALCTQRGVLPPGTVERGNLIQVLMPLATRPVPAPEPAAAPAELQQPARPAAANGKTPEAASQPHGEQERPEERAAKRPRTEHLGELRFTQADLNTMPLKTLRGLCIQHKVLPPCALERTDFLRALAPLSTDAPAPAPEAPGQKELAPDTAEELAERKARWARAANERIVGVRFKAVDLEVMPLKTLKALCVQHRVLPSCAVERADFVRALTPLVGVPAPGGVEEKAPVPEAKRAPAQAQPKEPPRRDYSKFLGAMKPNFTKADLEDMPVPTLRTLCIQHGALPAGEPGREELLAALQKLAVPPPVPRGLAPGVVHVLDE